MLAALRETRAHNPTLLDCPEDKLNGMCRAVLEAQYSGDKVYIDKSRGWIRPGIMEDMAKILGEQPKIIATVRPIPDCAASFVRLVKPENIPEFINSSQLIAHLKFSYNSIKSGFEKYPNNILFVEYDNLINSPQTELERIYSFLGMPSFAHNFDCIDSVVVEDDEKAWGIKDLHTIRPKLAKVSSSAKDVLGEELFEHLDVEEPWNPNKPKQQKIKLLDEALKCALRGDFANGEAFVDMQLKIKPDDNRALFNKGWYVLAKGRLQEGMRLLAQGRNVNVFGNPPPSNRPMWNGEDLSGKTLLLNLEGGLGDQICNARFAKNFAALGAKVILAGSPELAESLLMMPSVTAFVSNGGAVYHDYWIPSMSAALLLGLEYYSLDGSAYLPCNPIDKKAPFRIGIRWSGSPQFEHEQHRRFDPAPLFDLPAQLVSLQRDSDVSIPDYIEQPNLNTWLDTQKAIESVHLVITSCTSVAHMAAAMGKPTWVIVPILPYYLWAMPSNKSPWYSSVKLFRQTNAGVWDDVFANISKEVAAHV